MKNANFHIFWAYGTRVIELQNKKNYLIFAVLENTVIQPTELKLESFSFIFNGL